MVRALRPASADWRFERTAEAIGAYHETDEFSLAKEAVHPIGILRMATPPALLSFSRSWATHPLQLAGSGRF